MPTKNGSIRLFKLFGITVYLHWAWFLLGIYYVYYQANVYSSPVWTALEFLSLFAIVLVHEFSHQLACRSVGGQTHDIVLWFLGGVAYVSPPQRPGAQLWSIAAGPLVNVILVPILSVLVTLSSRLGWDYSNPNAYELVHHVWVINMILLCFNMLPIYPLDGGQILRSLLWYPFGRANSLFVVSIIGFIGVALLIILAGVSFFVAPASGFRFAILIFFIITSCWSGLRQAQALSKVAKAPRREGFACPRCQTVPPMGTFWHCGKCRRPFDVFGTLGFCPNCSTQFTNTVCLECGNLSPLNEWAVSGQVPPSVPPPLPPRL
ncbi:MAG: site-2 protease family protein [Limisphaerales bacterium]